jgi:hypothetical protein
VLLAVFLVLVSLEFEHEGQIHTRRIQSDDEIRLVAVLNAVELVWDYEAQAVVARIKANEPFLRALLKLEGGDPFPALRVADNLVDVAGLCGEAGTRCLEVHVRCGADGLVPVKERQERSLAAAIVRLDGVTNALDEALDILLQPQLARIDALKVYLRPTYSLTYR